MTSTSASASSSKPSPHDHKGAKCPVTGGHGFCPAQKGDSRSPCPALNTMANHGFISRSGKKLGAWEITQGLKACYGLTTPFAMFLSYTTFFLLRKNPLGSIDLYEIGKHGPVEHDASLVHHDTPAGEEYAPIAIDLKLVDEVVADAQTTTLYSAEDVGRSRVRREKLSPPLSPKSAEIARGEVAIILDVWEKKVGDKKGAPIEWIKQWLSEERLPEGWSAKPRSFGLSGTRERAKAIKAAAEKIREDEAKEKAKEGEKEKGDAPPVAAASATKAS
ncbi:Chloroperoxidase [Coprinopsis sp. MPI-PUGE-AT-0042]|nr:Chloroperoxidase [Coprinopsis sp. MPI-PUGE-AT-0042]